MGGQSCSASWESSEREKDLKNRGSHTTLLLRLQGQLGSAMFMSMNDIINFDDDDGDDDDDHGGDGDCGGDDDDDDDDDNATLCKSSLPKL